MSYFRTVGLLACLALSWPAGAAEVSGGALRPIRFAAEDWPPFVSPALSGDGLSGTLVRAAFERAGYRFRVDYFPWKRTMQFGLSDPAYAGFLAVWRTPERERLCHFSAPIGSTLTVLAYLKEAPLQAATLAQLKGTKIGTVAGYSNGEQFDALVRSGELAVEEGVNDDTNLRKLLTKRFRVIVIEKHVLRHLLLSTHFSQAERARITIAEHFFKERPVHMCFRRTPEGLLQQQRFNDAARELDLGKLEREYWKRAGAASAPAGLDF
ncbi:substrate-binding periplasmic protein [Janthinobacterium fluminis]|uniref:Transporter substrate-binding domain-containing protein n=1 Tax=Janthinobacterium fluminis TaxID=2987524 RepID=A0ABT5JXQ7_9BURK|nr:transporter substrate-binding domain-containing protein [Janthinobacterium fluminis]MDC8757215.1 transporter substrate-binding domain-containing protein [Janthinobacterium fluminis]